MKTKQGQIFSITKWYLCMVSQDFTVPKLPTYLSMRVLTLAKNENRWKVMIKNGDTSVTTPNFIQT